MKTRHPNWPAETDAADVVSPAADQGRAEAQFFLGNMYVKGQGVPEDYVFAHMWFTLAAAKGDEGAKEGRNMLAEHMTAAQIAEAQRLASEWKPKRKRM
jgi:uncharacterized protein